MYNELNGITSPNDGDTLWRYISFEKFVNMLATKSLFFTKANKYDDPFEGYIHKVTIDTINNIIHNINITDWDNAYISKLIDMRKKGEIQGNDVMCNCWHKNDDESMAMWEKYHIRNNGIAIKTTMEKLKNGITDPIDVYIGNIQYIPRDNFLQEYVTQHLIPAMHKGHSIFYHPYFFKRTVFEHEQEVRAIIDIDSISNNAFQERKEHDYINPDINDYGRRYNVSIDDLVDEVIISPYANNWIVETVSAVVQQYGFNLNVNKSTLLVDPTS